MKGWVGGLVGWWVGSSAWCAVSPTHQPMNPQTHLDETAPRTAPYKESP